MTGTIDYAKVSPAELLEKPGILSSIETLRGDLRVRLQKVIDAAGDSQRSFSLEDRSDILLLMELLREFGERGEMTAFKHEFNIVSSVTNWRGTIPDIDARKGQLLKDYLLRKQALVNGSASDDMDAMQRELAELEREVSLGGDVAEPEVEVLRRGEVMEKRSQVLMAFMKGKNPEEVARRCLQRLEAKGWNAESIAKNIEDAMVKKTHLHGEIRRVIEEEYDLKRHQLAAGCRTTHEASQFNGEEVPAKESVVKSDLPPTQETVLAPVIEAAAPKALADTTPVSPHAPSMETPVPLTSHIQAAPSAPESLVVAEKNAILQTQAVTSFKIHFALEHEDANGKTVVNFNTTNPNIAQTLQALVSGVVGAGAKNP